MANATQHSSVVVGGVVVAVGANIACQYNDKPRIGTVEEIVSFGSHNPTLVVAVPGGWRRFDITKISGLTVK